MQDAATTLLPNIPAGTCAVEVPRIESDEEIGGIVQTVANNAGKWHATSTEDRVALLKEVKSRLLKTSTLMGASFSKTRGFVTTDGEGDPAKAGLCGLSFAVILGAHIDGLIASLAPSPSSPAPFDTYADERPQHHLAASGAQVFRTSAPAKPSDGPTVDLYIQPGKPATRGEAFAAAHASARDGACVVLGAGNQVFLSMVDTLQKMFEHNYPVVLKHHDTMKETSKYIDYVFAPLHDAQCYAGLHCDVPRTTALLQHPAVAAAHLTGSLQTHDAIVWGPPHERESRKASNNPAFAAPFTSELGSVTPIVVVPGRWSDDQLTHRVAELADQMRDNANCNCLAPRVLLLPAEWHLADRFVALLKNKLRTMEATPAWYPGTPKVYERFLDAHDDVTTIESENAPPRSDGPPVLPYAACELTLEGDDDAADVPCFDSEFFAPVFVVARLSVASDLPADGPTAADAAAGEPAAVRALAAAYLARAVPFVNTRLWGNLVTSVLVDTETQAALPAEVQAAADALEYGSVIVNGPCGQAYLRTAGMWGGFQAPDTSEANPGSGYGALNNMLRYDHPQKQVAWYDWDTKLPQLPEKGVPAWLAQPMAGALSGGLRGVWAAMTPGKH